MVPAMNISSEKLNKKHSYILNCSKENENYPSPLPLPQGEGVRGRVKKHLQGK
jgi:hypothetical protein